MSTYIMVNGYRDRAVWITGTALDIVCGAGGRATLKKRGGHTRRITHSHFDAAVCMKKREEQLRRTTSDLFLKLTEGFSNIYCEFVTDDQQEVTSGLFICIKLALHVSGDVFAHHQEHLTVFTASDVVHLYCCRPVSWTRWNSLSLLWICNWWPTRSNF